MPTPPGMLSDTFRARRNMVEIEEEHWRPPLHASSGGVLRNLANWTRRLIDVQAGSVWRDLAPELHREHGTIVDVGCGAQPYRGLLPADSHYIGIDTADAKAHFGYEVPDTLYFDGTRWPIDDASADTVLATETLEHVIDPPQFLSEAFRTLKPGGRLVITVPFAARWHFVPHDYWRYTPSTLQRLFQEAGFVDVSVFARGNAVTVAAYKVMALILPLLFSQRSSRLLRVVFFLFGLVLLPVLLLGAIVARISLRSAGGDDCLGYTAFARRPAAA